MSFYSGYRTVLWAAIATFGLLGCTEIDPNVGITPKDTSSVPDSPKLSPKSGPYGYDTGFVDYDTLRVVNAGASIEGHFSPSLIEACNLDAPFSTILDRRQLALPYSVKCINKSGVERDIYVVEIGGSHLGPRQYIKFEKGLHGSCGLSANLDVRNTHPSQNITFEISFPDITNTFIKTVTYTYKPGEFHTDVLYCAWGSSWLSDAHF